MGEIPGASRIRFAKLAQQLAEGDGTKLPHRKGLGTGSLFVGKKMFAILGDTGSLIVKLPPARVQELIAAHVGGPWHPGTGAPLKEYVEIPFDRQAKWLGLAKEAREYMRSNR